MTRTSHYLVVIALLMVVSVALQVRRDRGWQAYEPATPVMWLRAGTAMKRAALGFDTLLADLYWIRSVVYFGRQGQSANPDKNYDLLHPMLDLVTTLDPRFTVAYRFGAIFLAEAPPDGPGEPELAIRLLRRGVEQSPERWEYLHDIGFVYYWHERNFEKGAEWLERASRVPGSPLWLKSTAASMHSQRGDRRAARQLWQQILDSADSDILRNTSLMRLKQFDAMDAIDQLNDLAFRFEEKTGQWPASWQELVAARLLRGIPVDPAGVPFELDPINRKAALAERSPLWPLPLGFTATPRR